MATWHYRYFDDYEKVSGEIEAPDASLAAIEVLKQCGSEPGRPRWKRYGISEKRITECPDDAELVTFSRLNEYLLELRKAGTRKRKWLTLFA